MSKPESPTLADAMIREWLKPEYRRIEQKPGWLAHTVAAARKFVLDERMSEFLGDLAYASLLTCGDSQNKACQLTDTIRQGARLPHALMWIEYDMVAKKRRVKAAYGNDPRFKLWADRIEGPTRCGWLLMQHPTIETAFMTMECASHSFGRSDTELLSIPQPNAIAYTWCSDDQPTPWPKLQIPKTQMIKTQDDDGNIIDIAPEGLLSGIPSYKTESFGLVYPPHIKREAIDLYIKKSTFNNLSEMASDARYLWSLLSTINDLPTKVTEVRPSKGFFARGKYRKFVEHSVITLTVPVNSYQRIAARAIAITRRRRHPVRGHWRKDWRLPLSPLCDHEFASDEQAMTCKRCHGRRMWVAEHERGDATLGFVTHDYRVERGLE